ncbi:MAG: rod shape-determining protein MreC [Coriobacteriaceae bacterium]|nr:rod shape-determining protein MreC [Coriobacteriaceae bacterium]
MQVQTQQTGRGIARRITFIVLAVLSLVLATVYAREGQEGPIHSVQNAIVGVTGEAAAVSAGFGAMTDGAGDVVDNALADEQTLTALREQNEELRRRLADADEYRQEAERLQELLNMKQTSGVTGPTARIIGRSTNAWDQSITIDLGSAEGVESGMTVMGAYGVIGQVAHTQEHSSTVRLLSDPNSGAAVMVQSTRADGIVRGSVSGLLHLEDLDEDEIPVVGDVIVTSGLGGSYERGLIIGTVVSVNKTPSNTTGSIVVSPNDTASMLEEVIVVFTAPDFAAKEKAEEEAKAAKKAEEEAQRQAEEQAYMEQVYGTSYGEESYGGYSDNGYSYDATTG